MFGWNIDHNVRIADLTVLLIPFCGWFFFTVRRAKRYLMSYPARLENIEDGLYGALSALANHSKDPSLAAMTTMTRFGARLREIREYENGRKKGPTYPWSRDQRDGNRENGEHFN